MGPCSRLPTAPARVVLAFVVSVLDYMYEAMLPHPQQLRRVQSALDRVPMRALRVPCNVPRALLWTLLDHSRSYLVSTKFYQLLLSVTSCGAKFYQIPNTPRAHALGKGRVRGRDACRKWPGDTVVTRIRPTREKGTSKSTDKRGRAAHILKTVLAKPPTGVVSIGLARG